MRKSDKPRLKYFVDHAGIQFALSGDYFRSEAGRAVLIRTAEVVGLPSSVKQLDAKVNSENAGDEP